MSIVADLAELATQDATVHRALMKLQADPELDSYTFLITLIKVLASQKGEALVELHKNIQRSTEQ